MGRHSTLTVLVIMMLALAVHVDLAEEIEALICSGEHERAEEVLLGLSEEDRDRFREPVDFEEMYVSALLSVVQWPAESGISGLMLGSVEARFAALAETDAERVRHVAPFVKEQLFLHPVVGVPPLASVGEDEAHIHDVKRFYWNAGKIMLHVDDIGVAQDLLERHKRLVFAAPGNTPSIEAMQLLDLVGLLVEQGQIDDATAVVEEAVETLGEDDTWLLVASAYDDFDIRLEPE